MTPPSNANGRPAKLTREVQQRLCDAIRAGNFLDTAAAFAGVDKTTLHRWLRRGARAKGGTYRAFHEAVEKALADSEARAVLLINKAAAEGSWQAAAWYLERKFPDRWGRKDRVDATVRGGIAHTHVDVGRVDLSHLSDEELNALEQIYSKIIPAADVAGDGGPPAGTGGEGTP